MSFGGASFALGIGGRRFENTYSERHRWRLGEPDGFDYIEAKRRELRAAEELREKIAQDFEKQGGVE